MFSFYVHEQTSQINYFCLIMIVILFLWVILDKWEAHASFCQGKARFSFKNIAIFLREPSTSQISWQPFFAPLGIRFTDGNLLNVSVSLRNYFQVCETKGDRVLSWMLFSFCRTFYLSIYFCQKYHEMRLNNLLAKLNIILRLFFSPR